MEFAGPGEFPFALPSPLNGKSPGIRRLFPNGTIGSRLLFSSRIPPHPHRLGFGCHQGFCDWIYRTHLMTPPPPPRCRRPYYHRVDHVFPPPPALHFFGIFFPALEVVGFSFVYVPRKCISSPVRATSCIFSTRVHPLISRRLSTLSSLF